MRLFASPGRVPSAVKTSTPRGKTNPAGSTPTTVKSTPVRVRPDPTTPGSAPRTFDPERVRDDDGRPGSLPVVRRPERAAEEGWHREGVEELAGDARALDGDRIAAAGQDVAVPVDGGRQGGQTVEARRLCLPLEELGIGKLDEARRVGAAGLPPDDEAVLLRERQSSEHDGIQHAEHGGAGADAQGQRGDGEQGDARAAARELSSQRVPQVASEVVEPPCAAHVAAQLLDLVQAAELEARAPARLVLGQAGPDVMGYLPLDMVAQFAVELAFKPVAASQPPPPAHRAPSSAVAESAAVEACSAEAESATVEACSAEAESGASGGGGSSIHA